MSAHPGVIVLAAGGASRYGAPKLALPVSGVPMVRRATLAALGVSTNVVVVIGAHSETIEPLIADLGVTIAFNKNWSSGMGHSLSFGVGRLREIAPHCPGALIVLADQVLIGEVDLKKLISAHHVAPKRIVAASYEGILGVPCVFPREYFDEIERLRGDVGARGILNRQRNAVIAVPMPKAQLDIDRPEDCTRIWSEATKLVDLDKGGQ